MSGSHFTVKEYDITSPLLAHPMTAVLLSDLHNSEYGPENETLLAAVCDLNPDLILVPGDMLVGSRAETWEIGAKALAGLAEIAPTFFANGNHETRIRKLYPPYRDKYRDYITYVRQHGVHVLNNRECECEIAGNWVHITGLEIPKTRYKKLRRHTLTLMDMRRLLGVGEKYGTAISNGNKRCKPAFSEGQGDECGKPAFSEGQGDECRKPAISEGTGDACGEPERAFGILLAHNPAFADTYFDWGADLTVSGHFHGGLIRSPFSGRALLDPYGFPLPRYGYGHYEKEGKHLIVTSGIGDHNIPIRIFNPHEIVCIHFQPDKK